MGKLFTQQLKSSSAYTLAVVFTTAVPVLTLPIFARVLTKEDFGILALSEIYAVFVAGIAFLGSSIAFDRNFFAYAKDQVRLSQLIYSILAFVCFNFIILLMCTIFWGEAIAQFLFRIPGQTTVLTLDLCGTFFASVFDLFLAFYRNSKRPSVYLKFSLINCVLYLGLSLLFLLGFHWSVTGILLSKFVSLFILSIVLLIQIHRECPFHFSWVALKEAWAISLPLTPRIFLGVFSARIDRYLINILGSLGGVGIYSIGQKIGYLVFAFENALENVFQPHAYQQMFDDPKKAQKEIGEYLAPFFYAATGGALLLVLFCQEIMGIVLPKSYAGVNYVVMIFSAYYVVLFFSKIGSMQLIYLKKTYITSALLLVTYGVNIVMSIFFIKHWASLGAAYATLVTGIIMTALTCLVAQHFYRILWPHLKIAAIFMAFIIASIVAWNVSVMNVPLFISLLIKIILICLYGLMGLKLSLIAPFLNLEFLQRGKK